MTFRRTGYDALVTSVVDQGIKKEIRKVKNFCGIQTNVKSEQFKLNLARYITDGMHMYWELEEIIFLRQ